MGRRAQARGAGCRWRMCNIFNMCIYIWPSFHFSSALWRLLIASQLGCNLIRCNSLCFFFITSHFAFETVLCLFSLMFKCAACNQLRQINHCRESERQFYQKQNFIRIETTATTCRTTIANCLLASSSFLLLVIFLIFYLGRRARSPCDRLATESQTILSKTDGAASRKTAMAAATTTKIYTKWARDLPTNNILYSRCIKSKKQWNHIQKRNQEKQKDWEMKTKTAAAPSAAAKNE